MAAKDETGTVVIPRHEREVVAAGLQRFDQEIVSTCGLQQIVWQGILLCSVYKKADDYLEMIDIVAMLDPSVKDCINAISCNCGAFTVFLLSAYEERANLVASAFSSAALARLHRHRGVWVLSGSDCVEVKPATVMTVLVQRSAGGDNSLRK